MSVEPVFAGACGSCPPAGVPVGGAGATPGPVVLVTVVVVFVVFVVPFVVLEEVVEVVLELPVVPDVDDEAFVALPLLCAAVSEVDCVVPAALTAFCSWPSVLAAFAPAPVVVVAVELLEDCGSPRPSDSPNARSTCSVLRSVMGATCCRAASPFARPKFGAIASATCFHGATIVADTSTAATSSRDLSGGLVACLGRQAAASTVAATIRQADDRRLMAEAR